MNILFAGTPKPSAKILKALCDDPSINIVLVIDHVVYVIA